MRKLIVTTFVSLDGVMQAPGGSDEDRDGGFEHGGWAVPHIDQQVLQLMAALTSSAGALLLGRRTRSSRRSPTRTVASGYGDGHEIVGGRW